MADDLAYLLRLGLGLDQIAARTKRTRTAVERELQAYAEQQEKQARSEEAQQRVRG